MRNLILTGGIRHNFTDNADAITEILADAGFESEATEDIDAGIARLATGHFDLVTVIALRWPMEGDPKYAPYREAWAYHMPEASRRGLEAYVAQGGGLFGLHTAALCFDDWDGWLDLLGGRWSWGISYHPPLGRVSATPTGNSHVITSGLHRFSLHDEVFCALSLAEDVVPLLAAQAEGHAEQQPVVWARNFGAGRVAYDALGHDRSSLEDSNHKQILQRCALWAGHAGDETVARF